MSDFRDEALVIMCRYLPRERCMFIQRLNTSITRRVKQYFESNEYYRHLLHMEYGLSVTREPKHLYMMLRGTKYNCQCYETRGIQLFKECIKYDNEEYYKVLFEAGMLEINIEHCFKVLETSTLARKIIRECEHTDLRRNLIYVRFNVVNLLLDFDTLTEDECMYLIRHSTKITPKLLKFVTLDDIMKYALKSESNISICDIIDYDKEYLYKYAREILLSLNNLPFIEKYHKDILKLKVEDSLLEYRAKFIVAYMRKRDVTKFDRSLLVRACIKHGPCVYYSPILNSFKCMSNAYLVIASWCYSDVENYLRNSPYANRKKIKASLRDDTVGEYFLRALNDQRNIPSNFH